MKKTITVTTVIAVTLAAGLATSVRADTAKPTADRAFGDWVLHCTKPKTGEEACALHQKVLSAKTKLPVAAFALARHKDSHELRLAVILPLGLDIPAGVSGKAGAAPLAFAVQTCVRRGCVANTQVDDRLLEALRATDSFTTTFKMRGVSEPTTVPVSLKGLGDGLKALEPH